MNPNAKKSSSTIKFGHYGRALLNVAQTYEKLPQVILEYIQNAIDVGAKDVCVVINFKKRFVTITDDGDGVSIEEFEEALESVGVSSKKGKMGRYGFGLVSALGKCEYFTFTSCPKSSASIYRMWVFDTKEIAEQKTEVSIPNEKIPGLLFNRTDRKTPGKDSVNWRTRIRIDNFVRDNVLSRISIDELSNTILERFSVPMKKLGTTVRLKVMDAAGNTTSTNVRALAFTGQRIPEKVYAGGSSGETSIELFLAKKRKGKKMGKISVGIKGDPFRIGFGDFAFYHNIFSSETIEILSSGIFEGYILSEKCTLDPSRKGFSEDDPFMEFCDHIERWVSEEGSKFYEESVDEKRTRKYQLLGSKAMRNIEAILKMTELKDLMDVILGFKKGTTGTGHTEMQKTEVGKQDEKSLRVRKETSPSSGTSGTYEPKIPEKPKTEDHPFSVVGAQGTKRVIVKGHSTGLQFRYDQIPGNPSLWNLNLTNGILTFNVRHELWQLAEKSGSNIMIKFQEHVALAALNAARYPDREFANDQAESHIGNILQLFIIQKK